MNNRHMQISFSILIVTLSSLFLRPQHAHADISYIPVQADTYVLEALPKDNFGGLTTLISQSQPQAITYMQFQIPSDIPNTAYMYLHFYNPGDGANQVQLFANTNNMALWQEYSMTYLNRPPLGILIGVGGVPNEGWVAVNVDNAVRTALGGHITFALTHGNTTPLTIYSREMPGYVPYLRLGNEPTPQECNMICPP